MPGGFSRPRRRLRGATFAFSGPRHIHRSFRAKKQDNKRRSFCVVWDTRKTGKPALRAYEEALFAPPGPAPCAPPEKPPPGPAPCAPPPGPAPCAPPEGRRPARPVCPVGRLPPGAFALRCGEVPVARSAFALRHGEVPVARSAFALRRGEVQVARSAFTLCHAKGRGGSDSCTSIPGDRRALSRKFPRNCRPGVSRPKTKKRQKNLAS